MPSAKLAPACSESLFGGDAAVESINSDRKLKLWEESRLWTLVEDLEGKGKTQESMGCYHEMPLVPPFSNGWRANPALQSS